MLWSLLLFIITVSILITIHEFGHYFIARLCGVKVERFSIGFGKKIWGYQFKNGLELIIAMVPLGGYVKMLDSRIDKLPKHCEKFAFNHKKVWQRSAIIMAGPLANFLLAFILFCIIFMNGIMIYPVKIESILKNSPASMANIPNGVELKKINNIQISNWNDVNAALIGAKGNNNVNINYLLPTNTDEQTEILHNVDISRWQFDLEKESAITAFGFIPKALEIYPIISKIVAGSAAEKAGLRIGDEIIAYNNKQFNHWNDFVAEIKKAKPISLIVKRNNNPIYLDLVPTLSGNGDGVAGIYPSSNAVNKRYGWFEGLNKGFEQTILTTQLTIRSFYQLITGVIGIKHLSGPISIAKNAGDTASYGFTPYLYFLALISINLGVINLIPLPMLDGGHLVLLIIEKIKGAPINENIQERFFLFGFILLAVIMSIALFNDILRL